MIGQVHFALPRFLTALTILEALRLFLRLCSHWTRLRLASGQCCTRRLQLLLRLLHLLLSLLLRLHLVSSKKPLLVGVTGFHTTLLATMKDYDATICYLATPMCLSQMATDEDIMIILCMIITLGVDLLGQHPAFTVTVR